METATFTSFNSVPHFLCTFCRTFIRALWVLVKKPLRVSLPLASRGTGASQQWHQSSESCCPAAEPALQSEAGAAVSAWKAGL